MIGAWKRGREAELSRESSSIPTAAIGPYRAGSAALRDEGTLTDKAYQLLEQDIVTLKLAPDSVVSEAILSRRLGIGTTPVREALQQLARDRLVRILPRRGVVITSVDVREQMDVLETRRCLDRLVACKAASRSTVAERAELPELIALTEAATEAGDVHEFVRLDGQLNLWFTKVMRNAIATEAATRLHAVSRRFWFFHLKDQTQFAETSACHVGLIRGVASGCEDQAGAASDRLIDYLVDFATATLLRK